MANEIWARPLPRERPGAFAAFCAYRDQGSGRAHSAVVRQLGKSHSIISRWSARYAWTERAQAYDIYLDARQRAQNEKRILAAREKSALLAEGWLAQAQRRLVAMDPDEIPVTHLMSGIAQASELLLKSLGWRDDKYDDPAALDNVQVEIVIVEPDTGETRDWQE